MSTRFGAPYKDRVEENGRILIYEGHDNPRPSNGRRPKEVDQESMNPDGSLTQNGLFCNAAVEYKSGLHGPEIVRVYEKIRPGIWVYNGLFSLQDAWKEDSDGRSVYKFRMQVVNETDALPLDRVKFEQTRMIPSAVKLEVWKRDGGKCVLCKAQDNLHFDHIIPYSKGGTSLDPKNVQLLCVRHNLEKHDKIQ